MWDYAYSAETVAPAEAIWQLWADVAGWRRWDPALEKVDIDGPFAAGSVIVMTPAGEDEVRLRLTEVVDGELFVDEANFGDVLIRTIHHIEPVDRGRSRIVYRTEITGAAADQMGPEIGPAITSDFPDKIAALIALAEDR